MTTRMELDFQFVHEPTPGDEWKSLFEEFWPAYRRWYFDSTDRSRTRPDYATCTRMLKRHLPGMVAVHEQLTDLAGGGDDVARFLTLYSPPPSIRGCTQAVWQRDSEIALVRNYDFAPRLCDGVVLRSQWSGMENIALTDCLVGALDGMNDDGLAVCLAFGGDKSFSEGFGATILVRAILESCSSVAEAVKLVARIPVYMAYTLTIVDARGKHATVFLRPGRDAEATGCKVSTNHQKEVRWPEHARLSRSVERHQVVDQLVGDHQLANARQLAERFLAPPLYCRKYTHGAGTLYTAVYSPRAGTLDLLWPNAHRQVGFRRFQGDALVVRYEPQDVERMSESATD